MTARGRKRTLSKRKARAMLKRREYTSARQRRFLGARASGQPVKRRRRNPAVSESKSLAEASRLVVRAAGTARSASAVRDLESASFILGTLRGQAEAGIHRNPRKRRRRNPAKSRGRELVAFTVRRGGKAVGKVLATTAAAAAREAKAAGLQLGRELKGEFCKANPPRGAVLSERAESITYKHHDDGEWYRHKFAPGVLIKVAPDRKSVTLFRPDGKPVAGNFWVP